jgi:hypothetical protein
MLYGSDEPHLEFDAPRRAAVRFPERDPVLTIAMIVTHSQGDLRESRLMPAVADTIHRATPADSAGNGAFLVRLYVAFCDISEFGFSVMSALAGIQIRLTASRRRQRFLAVAALAACHETTFTSHSHGNKPPE